MSIGQIKAKVERLQKEFEKLLALRDKEHPDPAFDMKLQEAWDAIWGWQKDPDWHYTDAPEPKSTYCERCGQRRA